MPKVYPGELSTCELLILRMLTYSYSAHDIARAMGMSHTAAQDVVAEILAKLTRAERAEQVSRMNRHNATAEESRYRH